MSELPWGSTAVTALLTFKVLSDRADAMGQPDSNRSGRRGLLESLVLDRGLASLPAEEGRPIHLSLQVDGV